MAFIFGDSFDLYTVLADAATYWDSSVATGVTLAVSTSGRFAGSRSVNIIAANNIPYLTKTSSVNDAVHHISLAIQQTLAISGTSLGFFITLFDGATAQCSVVFRSDGAILLTSGIPTGTALATYTGALPANNTWYQFEIEVVINNTAGSFAVRKLGNTSNDFSAASLNTRASANNYANKIGIGASANVNTQIADDFLWRSDAASVAWVGDIRCYVRRPASDVSVAWTPSGSVVPLSPFTQGTTGNTLATQARYQVFTPICSGTIGTVVLPLAAADSGNMKCTIFSDGGGNTPGTILGSATPLSNLPLGNNTFTFSTPVSVTVGTRYWVGFMTDTAVTNGWNITTATQPVTQACVWASATYASFPTNNPTVSAGTAVISTVNITPTGAVNAPFVADITQDGAATYVYSSTVSQSDLYNPASLAAAPQSVIAVTTRAYMQKSDAGTRVAAAQLQSGAANVQASLTLNTTWGWTYRTDQLDPNTGQPWLANNVDAADFGVILTA